MKPNNRLEEALRTAPPELIEHYRNLLDRTEKGVEQPDFFTLYEADSLAESNGPQIVRSTGWKNLDHVTAGGLGQGEAILLAAPSGAGKTHFAVSLAINQAMLGRSTFYLSVEDGWDLVRQRFGTMDRTGASKDMVFMMHEDELTMDNAKATIKRAIDDADLIIIDNLFALPMRQGKTDYWQSQAEWVDDISNLVRGSRSTVLFLHHVNKNKENEASRFHIAGSTRLVNRVAQVWLMKQGTDDPSILAVNVEKNRRALARGMCFLKSGEGDGRLHPYYEILAEAAQIFQDFERGRA